MWNKLNALVNERNIPPLMSFASGDPVLTAEDWRARRREMIDILSREEYGYTPAAPAHVTAEVTDTQDALAAKATAQRITLSFDTPNGPFSFPISLFVPKGIDKAPAFVYIAFRPDTPDRYLPLEEIIDHGFAVAVMWYLDITADSGDFDKLATMYPRDSATGWGKIGMWAFGASRIMDYLITRPDIDAARVAVSGHSRLGKTALWCGAQDERFAMVISNDSGCSGAAITRDKVGESAEAIANRFPYWFCGNYQAYKANEAAMPFDQHMLLSLVAPRRLYVCSAQMDEWADPASEFLSCVAASEAWSLLRVPGLISPDEMPTVNMPLMDGGICYHVRTGSHFHSRTDWLYHMTCRERYLV